MILLATVLFVLATIIFLRTWRLQSKQISPPLIVIDELNGPQFAKRLSDVIQFPTIAGKDHEQTNHAPFLALHEYLQNAFPQTHEVLQRETVGEDGLSLLYTWEGTDPSAAPFLLMSHIDVVPVAEDSEKPWTHPPFGGEVAEGYIWGRGALDVKCGAVATLEAVEFLLAKGFQPKCTIYIAMGHDEEVGGRSGNAKIAALLKQRDVRLRYVLDEGGAILDGVIQGPTSPVAYVGISERECAGVRLTVTGPGGHGSMPPRETVIGILAAAIHQLESHPMPTRIDGATDLMLDYLAPEMPFSQKTILANRWLFDRLVRYQFAKKPSTNSAIRTTWAPTIVEGGEAENILPKKASVYFNVRLLPGDTAQDVLAHVKRVVRDDRVTCLLETNVTKAPGMSDITSADFAKLNTTIREVFPDVIVSPGLTTGSTDSPHYQEITDNTFRFIPLRLTPDDLKRIHGIDERISVKNYLEVIHFFIQQIRNSAS